MSKMFVEERRQQILDLLSENKRITIQELVERINVSDATLRNDLAKMEKDHLLKRTHGGAISLDYLEQELTLSTRESTNKNEKLSIAMKAFEFIQDDQSIMLDASSTALELAKLLSKTQKRLTIVTNGINTALELNQNRDITVILLGGILQKSSPILEGSLGIDLLSKINIDTFFVSANGFTITNGMQDFSVYEVELKKYMIKNAAKVVGLLDYSKFGKNSIATFASITDIDIIITDQKIADNIKQEILTASPNLNIIIT
ncbi:DeoR/GlpR transcriptional regulator [Psychrobacillus sp. INOP01]|uniref:DeoR/GlpR family DNA-binding transcription regulator n=1 Tax=Psychrobacillus sp. INOP01 TaxID=2829187 RepID=UPI001BA94B58|nr:DeoR/GlpR family DNA-binding transcription regulator [Psychrobacillus sp. INOP01]QUG42602.1 DeoR/GlpR transcriptional regulator [Psychrobacillus sp. INOP01]